MLIFWRRSCPCAAARAWGGEEKAIRRLGFSPVACFSWLAAEGPPGEHPLMKITGSRSPASDWHRVHLSARGESLGCVFRTKALMLGNVRAPGRDDDYFWRVGLRLVVCWKPGVFPLRPASKHLLWVPPQHPWRGGGGSLLVPPRMLTEHLPGTAQRRSRRDVTPPGCPQSGGVG